MEMEKQSTIIIENIIMRNLTAALPFVQAMDAFFPIGAYTMSNGMETYVQKKIVRDKESLFSFVKNYISILTFTELGFAAHAAMGAEVEMLDGLCSASKVPKEVREGSRKLCSRFLKAESFIGNFKELTEYQKKIDKGSCEGYYCIAIGLLMRQLDMQIEEGLLLYGYNQISAMVNHGVKLVPLRQLEGQWVLHQTMVLLEQAVQKAMASDILELGVSGAAYDIRCMEHETLAARMYLS